MTLTPGSRRGFLASGLALLAMPAVVKAEGLMKVAPTSVILPEYKFDRRVLVDYHIASDSLMMRVDVVQGRVLPRPPRVLEVSLDEARKVFGADHPIFDVQPALGQQKYAMTQVGNRDPNDYSKWMGAFSEPRDKLVMGVREFGS
jgi:hypothetical protein